MTRIHCVTLPVDDLKRSIAFYRNGLGMGAEEVEEGADHVALELPGGLCLVLILRSEFTQFTKLVRQGDAPKGASECILSFFAASREEVDAVLQSAGAAGGAVAGPAADKPWGYAGYVADPDGHLWEFLWNPRLT
ncbi:VOC family protein [Stigmatella sp. ncwal1]|uniref:VOC family protein n=1 Tax=Stigmatella ashevillensis TaxID=2995309 RepID=A0ABT5DNN1_9BACT|nr:VOC family protein [Stigmatella ashevillena]MDC0715208.1 VOC family protein [Stigmatella ashevillena]